MCFKHAGTGAVFWYRSCPLFVAPDGGRSVLSSLIRGGIVAEPGRRETEPGMTANTKMRGHKDSTGTRRFSGVVTVVAVALVFFAITVMVAAVVDVRISNSPSEPAHTQVSGLPPAGPGSAAGHLNGDGSMSAPTGASFIYLIGGWSP